MFSKAGSIKFRRTTLDGTDVSRLPIYAGSCLVCLKMTVLLDIPLSIPFSALVIAHYPKMFPYTGNSGQWSK